MINTRTITNENLKITDILNAVELFDDFTDNLDLDFYSFRKRDFDEVEVFSSEPDVEEVAGMYISDQDTEILSVYSNLQEAVTDYVTYGEYSKWNESFTCVTYREFLNKLVERDLLPKNYIETVIESVNNGNYKTISDFIDRVNDDFDEYVITNNIATEGFLSEVI